MGFVDAGRYVLDVSGPGQSNAGHDYGDLIEYLKTL